jgi:hypothetical protein
MKILKSDLDSAAQKGIITKEQSDKLWGFLDSLREHQPTFRGLHIWYYFGGLLIMSSMTWLLSTVWESGIALMIMSALFSLLYLFLGHHLWKKEETKIPGGLLITAAVSLVPLFIFGFESVTGIWPQGALEKYHDYYIWIKGSWFFLELGTIVASLIALKFYPFPFITFPLAFSLWFMSMDLTPLLFGKTEYTFEEARFVSCIFGFCMLVLSYFIDRKYRNADFAFWTYLYGMMTFWVGLTLMESKGEFGKFIYFLLNVIFVFLSVYLRRKVFLVFGALGVFMYLGHLTWDLFKDSFLFTFVLAFIGIVMILLGVVFQKNKRRIEAYAEGCIPHFLKQWRPEERV